MARVVVTGGAGFLGSHLCEALIARGDEVVALDSLITGRRENLAMLDGEPGFSFVECDVSVDIPVSGHVDAVMHFASPASPFEYLAYPFETLDAGSLGTRRGLELARTNGARFLLASTSEIYGEPLEHPQRETYWGNVNSIGPRAVYDEAKRFAETLTMTYHREFGLDVGIVRIFNTYGPRLRAADGRVVSNFVVQAMEGQPLTVYGDGTQTRAYCYVEDEARGILALLDSGLVGPINIGNPTEFTVLQLAQLVLDVTESSSELVFKPLPTDDPTRRCPDIALARTLLDWEPAVSLRDGLMRTFEWYQKERARDDLA
jgi:dTDP-glucose 4,6-dehydratase